MKRLLITINLIILFSYYAISQEQKDSVSTVNKVNNGFYYPMEDSIIVEDPLPIDEQDKEIDLKRTELLNRNVAMLGFGLGVVATTGHDIEFCAPITYSIWARVTDNLYVIPKVSLYTCFSLAFSVGKKIIIGDNYILYTSLGMSYMIKGEIFRPDVQDFMPEINLFFGKKINFGLSIGNLKALLIIVSF